MHSAIALALVKFIHKSVAISLDPWSMCMLILKWLALLKRIRLAY